MNFELYQDVHIIYGQGKASYTGELMAELGLKRAFVVCDAGIVRSGILGQVTRGIEDVGLSAIVYDKVAADPPSGIIDTGARRCKDERCDAVIAVGGGSSIDTAKGINLLRYNPGEIMDYADGSRTITKCQNLIALPTTSGTGSELSDGLVVTGPDHLKHPILAANAMVNYAILDPALTLGMPADLTASTGMDTLAHAIEAYTSAAATLISDQICEGNISAVIKWLPAAVADGANTEARSHMLAASAISGWMLRYGHTHAGHSIAHVIGARLGIPHGLACAYALPWVVAFNAEVIPEKTRRIGELFGCVFTGKETPGQIGEMVRRAFVEFRDRKLRLRQAADFQSDTTKFSDMAKEIETELFQAFNPRKMSAMDAEVILYHIFQK